MQAGILAPLADVGPMAGIQDGGVERILEEDGVEFVLGAEVEEPAIVPALESQAVGVDAERPSAGGGGSGGDGNGGGEKVAAGHFRLSCGFENGSDLRHFVPLVG
jgi:hypothetical protein